MSNARFSILQARAISDKRVTDAQFRTLASLGMYADRDGWCFPSLARIGADCNKSKQAAGRDIVNLKRCGYVEVYPQFDKTTGGRRPNKYRLKFDPPVNVDDSTPSTPGVDTPSTPGVDVNVPVNAPSNNGGKPPISLTPEEIEQATRKADAILGLAIPADPSKAWRGRDMMQPELLHYADWYNTTTGQVATKANRASWWKALRAWEDAGLEIKHLQEAYSARSKWRTVADPNELTKDAAAIKALGSVSKPTPAAPPVTYDENGIPESY